jgi:methylmalonyl-CoA/ethylmalonyl-CoA epimerase
VTIELLEPLGADSPVARSLQSGTKLVHLCFEVTDLDEALAMSRAAGFHLLGTPLPSPAFDDRRIGWIFSRDYGLIELAECATKASARTGNPRASDCLLTRLSRSTSR